ncbi:universal stress protein [Halopenitus salinus]|uniref:Universal stress protein n=1 Tax=Halopenitus salinus TaxID=1198295 RepID=A0ABD5UWL9_9EURY
MGIDTILLAVGADNDDRVRRLGEETAAVAGPCGSEVVLAHVYTDDEYDRSRERLNIDPQSEESSPDYVAGRHASIRDLEDRMDEDDIETQVRGVVGERGESIVELAEEVEADRVVVGGRRRSPTGKAVFGSVAQEVMLSAPCPVTFVRQDLRGSSS